MANSKVVFDGKVLIDLTSDTVTSETLLAGETAHNAAGDKITGTAGITSTDDGNGNVTIKLIGVGGISAE